MVIIENAVLVASSITLYSFRYVAMIKPIIVNAMTIDGYFLS
jgi:hypothetical protein